MITELKTYLIRCDGNHCGHQTSTVIQDQQPSLPMGWTTKTVDNCGMTNYSKTIHLCGYCSSFEKKGMKVNPPTYEVKFLMDEEPGDFVYDSISAMGGYDVEIETHYTLPDPPNGESSDG